jgi:Na(+)-translocating NADH:ubiquinone oxidoreductase B subunit
MLEDLFDRLRPRFGRRPLGFFKPLFDATNNFFFWPKTPTRVAPYIRDPLDVKRYMSMVIVAMAPALVAGVYLFGLRVLVLVLVSYAVGGAVEVAFACLRKEEINEGFLVTGLVFPLILPPGIPIWIAAMGIALGVIIGKELFGGTGRNLFNAALVGRCIVTLGYPKEMARWIEPASRWPGRLLEYATAPAVDAVTAATPLAAAKNSQFADLGSLFWGNVQGSVGETSAACILAGGLLLVFVRVVNWRTTVSILGSFATLGLLLGAIVPGRFGPVGWHMLAGGLLFGAVFMATDPVTGPTTNTAKVIYGILIGAAVLLIRNLTVYVEGMTFAILLGNIAAPALDEAVIRWRARRLRLEA